MKKLILVRFFLAVLFIALCTPVAMAANIKIKGAVKDKLSKEPLIGATIRIVGTQAGAVTDMEGNFELNGRDVLEGMYDIEIKYVGYKTEVRRKVRVENGNLVILNLELETDAHELADVVVVAKKNRENENMLLLEQQKAVIAVQSVGVKELSRKGVSDAEGAVAKVAGVSKQEGVKNVFVRGLGDRYNATTFNGFPIPSEDPEYKNISLDFFSTDIIQTVGVNKAFNAGGISDVSGANIDITSKELIGSGHFNAGVSAGLNTQTLTADFLKMDGVNILGIADKTQPAFGNHAAGSSAAIDNYTFKNSLDPSRHDLQINRSYGLSGGKRFYLGPWQDALSFYLVAAHNTDYQYAEEELRNTTTNGTVYKDQTGKVYEQKISQLALANIDYDLQNRHHLSYNFMMVHDNVQSVGDYTGMNSGKFNDDYDNMGFTRRQQTNDNLLIVNQLMTNWGLTKTLSFDAGASYNKVKGAEPDRRINNLRKSADGYTLLEGNSQQRYFSELNEDDLNVKTGFTYRLADNEDEISNIRIGYNGRFVNDSFEATEYNMTVAHPSTFQLTDFALDSYYNPANFQNGWFEIQRNIDTYTVKKKIHSAYAEAIYQFNADWIVNLGVKYDNVDVQVDYDVNRGGEKGSGSIRKDYFLPSLNVKHNLTSKHALRLSASKTYTLPQPKEISPYRYVGVNFNSQGNEKLQPSDNYNLDLKWDFNPTQTELISLTAFYKHIKNPISRIEVASAGNYLSYENISDRATVAGVELEVRKNLFTRPAGKDASGMNRLSVGLNGSYINTHAKVPGATVTTGSQLEGAAPWIANFDLSHTFTNGERSFINTLVLNYVSDKVYTIGTQGFQDIMEHGIATLDFVSQARLNKYISLNLKARNLLNPAHKLSRKADGEGEKIVLSDYKKGINISLGVSCTF